MLNRILVPAVLLTSACVTVNIYFPAAAVERAADQIVRETWGGPKEPTQAAPKPQSLNRYSPERLVSFSWVSEAYAQEADINVSNPAIRALKDSIKQRSSAIKPFMDRFNYDLDRISGCKLRRRNEFGGHYPVARPSRMVVEPGARDRVEDGVRSRCFVA